MSETEIELVDAVELYCDQSFLQFNVKKKNICKEFFSIWLLMLNTRPC